MVPVAVIPGHITALYVFAVVNLMALFHVSLVEADIMVLNKANATLQTLPDMPAQFGPPFPEDGLWGHVVLASPDHGCTEIAPAREPNKWIALMSRGNSCNFETKVHNAQKANFIAAIVHNYPGENELIPMGRSQDKFAINISSCFIGYTDANFLIHEFSGKNDTYLVIDNHTPFNFNINYLVPFAIVVGICFILMVIFMVARWVLDYRKRRKSRLSKDALKKIPIKKFKKGDHYDVCAICLDEYEEGEKLRILPCSHGYHMKCIDPWLTKSKRNCPVCKRKVIPGDDSDTDSETDEESEGAAENTPLLTANNTTMNSHNTDNFSRSGLPASMRGAVGGLNSDSDSDTDPPSGSSYQSQSLAQVHASPRHSSYGATAGGAAEVIITNELGQPGSPPSSLPSREGYECLDGAVGGQEISAACEAKEGPAGESSVEFFDDHFSGDNEMSGLISGGETSDSSKDSFLIKILGKKGTKRRRDDDDEA